MTEPLLKIEDVMRILNVSKHTVLRLMERGEIQRIRISPKATRIDPQSVQDFINRQRERH